MEEALKKATALTHSEIVDYTAAPIFMSGKEKGAHEWFIEFKELPANKEEFDRVFDKALQEINSDYEAKRKNNMTLNPPTIHYARTNLFYDWLKSKNKLGGQHKVPRLSNNRELVEELLILNNSHVES